MLHSDRGTQFTSDEYQRFLNGYNSICSMSDIGSRADDAACDCFFGLLNQEGIKRRRYVTLAEAQADIFD